ncbi:hypothetical protein VB735_00225 [Halotia wernerae UHCC 0503]|nr:hypothetical protein [Halotia wernerae UHCC 0503]
MPISPEFEISTVNFGSDTTAPQDLVDLFMAGIADSGHVVRYSQNRFYPNRFQLFIDRLQPELLDYLVTNRIPYGLIVTEEVADDGAFGWSDFENSGTPYKIGRDYVAQIENARFVWCLLETSIGFCRRHNPRTGRVAFGFSERLMPRYPIDWDGRDIPMIATGPLTERRAAILKRIESRVGPIQHAGYPLAGWCRDNYLSRARVHVAPHRTDAHIRFVNPQRVVQSVLYKVVLAIERGEAGSHDLIDFCNAFAPANFVDGVWAMMSDPDGLRAQVETNFARLADERRMGPAFRDLIESTVV